jgi:hypothetical protein
LTQAPAAVASASPTTPSGVTSTILSSTLTPTDVRAAITGVVVSARA